MEFRISDTFTDSLTKLTGDEQKVVKTTAFDLQINPANPGMKFHRIEKAKDPDFWSLRVSRDIRLIVHKTDSSLLMCYVAHHDKAYQWAERRKIERHPATGAAQIVKIRETVREVVVHKYPEAKDLKPTEPMIFSDVHSNDLLKYGVPEEWLEDVKKATESTLFDIAEHLPAEAGEALLELATGGVPHVSQICSPETDPFNHPDAKRRFSLMANKEELERAFEYPWEKWTIFLHPAQREIVEREFTGPARISGSAGTGKTVVALHRAVYLVRNFTEARVLLCTFSKTLASALKTQLRRLIGNEPKLGERLEIQAIDEIGRKLYKSNFPGLNIASRRQIQDLLGDRAASSEDHKFTPHFLWTEWSEVVDAWQIRSWEEYRDIRRLGRKKRLAEKQRLLLWTIFESVWADLDKQGLITLPYMFGKVAAKLKTCANPPFDFAVVDEAQDFNVSELRFLASLGGGRANSLFFTGDLGQRIFQSPFSWKVLGIDIQGRSKTLKINYRTSHQIRCHADRLLPSTLSDVDGNVEGRGGTISIFEGTPPAIEVFDDIESERKGVSQKISEWLSERLEPHEIGIFVRSAKEPGRARSVVKITGVPWTDLDEQVNTKNGHLSICTMHMAKGLEFRAVIVMACDDDVIPLQKRIESVTDESDLEEVYQTERHLLYVACTRARDYLVVAGVGPASEFLDDLKHEAGGLPGYSGLDGYAGKVIETKDRNPG